mmetsp:Transcript_10577/g.19732  ORF Transcript_10577/g.19732 Transcript_10577/m.19732 type:complete len:437 (-) Transcript_10577:374-1684(-)
MINGRLAAAISCYWRTSKTKVLVLRQNNKIKINSNNIRSLCFCSSIISITSATKNTAIATCSATCSATAASASGSLVARMTKTPRKSIPAATTTSTKTITKKRRMTTSTGRTQTTITATTATINSNNVNSITSENHFVVSLEKNGTRMTIQLPSSSSTVMATPSNMPFEQASTASTAERAAVEESKQIPETVIQYERQLRKIQAASRASTPLCTSQLHRSIIYNDESMVVVNKPSGVLTVPGIHSNPSILTMLYDLFQHEMDPTTMTKKENMIVHRLDMDTSGIVVFAKTREAMSKLQSYFRDKKVSKTYEALLCGHLYDTVQEGVISLPLQKDHRFPPFMRVATPKSERDAKQVVKDLNHAGWKKIIKKNPKPSETIFQVIGREYVASSSLSSTIAPSCPLFSGSLNKSSSSLRLGWSTSSFDTSSTRESTISFS